jgi:hypothetical protein
VEVNQESETTNGGTQNVADAVGTIVDETEISASSA